MGKLFHLIAAAYRKDLCPKEWVLTFGTYRSIRSCDLSKCLGHYLCEIDAIIAFKSSN